MATHREASLLVAAVIVLASCGPARLEQGPASSPKLPFDRAVAASPGAEAAAELRPWFPPVQVISEPRGPLVARPFTRLVRTWHAPGPRARLAPVLVADNPFGQRISFAVERVIEDAAGERWARIRTGEQPNGDRAWVRARDVRFRPVRQRIVIDLSARSLVRRIRSRAVLRLSVGIGERGTPTVPGRYFVWARVRYPDPAGPYGKLALGLSGFSRVVRFGPTPGRLAIHGTPRPGDRGRPVSLGCVRVFNGEVGRLWNVPMGTPVFIRP